MWKFVKAGPDGDPAIIGGVDVWKHPWVRVRDEYADVRDPSYGEPHCFPVYNIVVSDKTITFAAGEFSAGIFAFYVPRGFFGFFAR